MNAWIAKWTGRTEVRLLAVALIYGAGMATGWKICQPKPMPSAKAAPEQVQKDGSRILGVQPNPSAKAAQLVPAGARVEELVQVTVQPRARARDLTPGPSVAVLGPTPGSAPQAAGIQDPQSTTDSPCPPVRVDLSLVRMTDQSRRVIASSPDGDVVGGIDVPVEQATIPRQLRSAVGIEWARNPWGDCRSLIGQRDLGIFRAHARLGLTRFTPPGGIQVRGAEAAVGLLVRF
jgi:hypothetical protein